MLRFLLRSLWRLIVLGIGISIVMLTIRIYPYADARFPAFFVLLVIWCLFAYLIIPALIRLLRVFIASNHIPHFAASGDGWPSDPVTLAIIAKDRAHLERAMNKAGWTTADPLTIKNGFMEVVSIIFNTPYPAAPLSNLYLFNRVQDIGFEISTNSRKSARTRHHVRFWRLEEPEVTDKNITHYEFWSQRLRHLFHAEKEIWIGAATEEIYPIDIQWHTGQLNHGASSDAERERDFLIETLKNTNQVKEIHTSEAGEKIKFRGQQFHTFYITDGSLKVVDLKRSIR